MKPAVRPVFDRDTLVQLSKEQLVEIILELEQRLSKLEVRVLLNSDTSSKPPSSDLLNKPEQPQPPQDRPKRKAGGQPGHTGQTRKGFGPPDRCVVLEPKDCSHCGGSTLVIEGIETQQVAQLVDRPIEIVEYRRVRCHCQKCGQLSQAPWPTSVVPGQDLDIKLQALFAWLGNYGLLSYEKQQEFLWELGGLKLSPGTLWKTNQRISQAVVPAVKAAWEEAKARPHVSVDESPWVVKGVKEWLWTLSGKDFCLFHAADTRSRAELVTCLGPSFKGVLSSDDFSVYNGYPVTAQQKCLAHLRRHFKKLELLGRGAQIQLGKDFLGLLDEAFEQHAQWSKHPDLSRWQRWVQDFQCRLEATITRWLGEAGYEAGKLLKSLRDKASQWWYFLHHPDIPPDNNLAERSLRLAVTKRKVSGGSRSMERFKETADLLSVVQTCRRQGRSVMEFFCQALSAKHHAAPMPSLISKPST